MNDRTNVMSKVRAALGRSQPLSDVPTPPVIDEPITRLVHTDFGLPELFIKSALENKIDAEAVYVDALNEKLIAFLREKNARRIALPKSPLLEKLQIVESLRAAGLTATTWDAMTIDELYDYDAGITDVYAAVAETGSLVVRSSPGHGRALSLVPPVHVAIVEPKNLLPDLVDLFEKMKSDGVASSTSLISGPSKTSDIELNLVVGVHGPMTVKVFVLQ
jgi:L-lactate dehydrogenase complex protein LldG